MNGKRKIDLNVDLGEHPEAWETDVQLMRYITSANIACGGHAGDAKTVRRALETAREFGVAAGAHLSFADRANFGRVAMKMESSQLEQSLLEQLKLIVDLARDLGIQITHAKPHGALYHAANSDSGIAATVAKIVHAVNPTIILVGQYGSPAILSYRSAGLRIATEAFADRAYQADGTLLSRSLPGALLGAESAVKQAFNIVVQGYVRATDGSKLPIKAETLCIHSDTPGALAIASGVRQALDNEGVLVSSLGENGF